MTSWKTSHGPAVSITLASSPIMNATLMRSRFGSGAERGLTGAWRGLCLRGEERDRRGHCAAEEFPALHVDFS